MGSLGEYGKISLPQTCDHDGRPTCVFGSTWHGPTTLISSESAVDRVKCGIFDPILSLKETYADQFIEQKVQSANSEQKCLLGL